MPNITDSSFSIYFLSTFNHYIVYDCLVADAYHHYAKENPKVSLQKYYKAWSQAVHLLLSLTIKRKRITKMYLAWILFAILILLLIFFSKMILNYYLDPTESYFLIKFTIIISFTASMICIILIPIDVFVTSQGETTLSTLDIKIDKPLINQLYNYCFATLLIITFLLLPFNFFYGEEQSQDYDIDIDYDKGDKKDQVFKSIKNTIYFVFILSLLLLFGLVFRPQAKNSLEVGKEVEWVKQLFDVDHVGEAAINFSLAILISVGTVFWIVYGSYGLSYLPLYLIKGTKSLEQEKQEVNMDLSKIRDKYRAIQEKYAKTHTKITKFDSKQLSVLRKKERTLNYKNEKINELSESSNRTLQKILKMISPFRMLIGVACLFMSGIVFGSLSLTTYDRLQNSKCGFQCGYMVEKKEVFNPLDALMVYTSQYFPLDYLMFFVLTSYIFICVLYGVIKFGIGFLCLKGYKLRRENTLPQALIITGFIMNISILVLCSQFITLSPQYTTFGAQRYRGKFCSLSAIGIESNYICKMTNISSLVNKISLTFPLFAIVGFSANLLFLFFNLVFLLISIFKNRQSNLSEYEGEEVASRDEESNTLIKDI